MRWTAAALIFVLSAAPTFAAEKEAEGDKTGAPGTNIEMPFLMAPMSGEDGKLSGYAYISSKLTATSDASANLVRDKIAFIQDAFVRDVNQSELAMSGTPAAVDNAALQARLLADAKRVMGQGKIASIAITQIQIAPLRPSPVTPAAAAPAVPETASAATAKTATKP
jgi:hypothetical protein